MKTPIRQRRSPEYGCKLPFVDIQIDSLQDLNLDLSHDIGFVDIMQHYFYLRSFIVNRHQSLPFPNLVTVVDAVDAVKGTTVCQLITRIKSGAGYTTPIRHTVNEVGAEMKFYLTLRTIPCEPGLHSLPASRTLSLSQSPVGRQQFQIWQSLFLLQVYSRPMNRDFLASPEMP